MITEKWPFYVKVEVSALTHLKFVMKFCYNTDCRFEQDVHSIDNSAIECWINGKKYNNTLNGINF